MTTYTAYPKIEEATALDGQTLRVRFDNGVVKHYDCADLLAEATFAPLRDRQRFQKVSVAPDGCGVIWSDELDLAEAEIWQNGRTAV